jgi:NAD(P)-dependent dehydrogenase (short-subunit alcohol dehydrogenase family)
MKKNKWTLDEMPLQEGRTAIVTGANSGLGFHIAKALTLKGARVIMACRNMEKGEQARGLITREGVAVDPELWKLDLASLDSVRQFADRFASSGMQLDLLINNAGLMAIPYARTEDGFEMQFGVNHLGHFALSALLWPSLSGTKGSRMVQVSSLAHRFGKIRFDDIHWEKAYKKWGAYGMSKLANLLFVRELSDKIKENGTHVTIASAHPGYADTELQAKGARIKGNRMGAASMNAVNKLLAQSGEKGALPVLYAATADGVEQGGYYGPGGWMKLHGWPVRETPDLARVNKDAAQKLWEVSERLTGTEFVLS